MTRSSFFNTFQTLFFILLYALLVLAASPTKAQLSAPVYELAKCTTTFRLIETIIEEEPYWQQVIDGEIVQINNFDILVREPREVYRDMFRDLRAWNYWIVAVRLNAMDSVTFTAYQQTFEAIWNQDWRFLNPSPNSRFRWNASSASRLLDLIYWTHDRCNHYQALGAIPDPRQYDDP